MKKLLILAIAVGGYALIPASQASASPTLPATVHNNYTVIVEKGSHRKYYRKRTYKVINGRRTVVYTKIYL